MNSLITPIVVERQRKMPLSGLTADIERGKGLQRGQIWTATVWRQGRDHRGKPLRPIVLVMPSRGALEQELAKVDRIYERKAQVKLVA